jgi:hypothetical protein
VSIDLRPSARDEAPDVSGFLRRTLQRSTDDPALADTQIAWKYWSTRPGWSGSRSFTARHNGTIVAHAAVWPTHVRASTAVVPAAHVIDWAADPAYPGAGIWIMRQIAMKVSLMLATGGSEITRRILPLIGFRPHGELDSFALPVRPLRQLLTTSEKTWTLPARLLRNVLWRASSPLALPRGWSARPLTPERVPEALWPQPSRATAVTTRDAEFYRYLLDSPCARHRLFGLEKNGELVGYFCLAFAAHVARIADLWLPSTALEDWYAAFRTAAVAAALEDDVYEVSAWASTGCGKEALGRAGFRLRDRSVLSVSGDPRILDGRTLHVQMVDCDASFLSAETVSYLT